MSDLGAVTPLLLQTALSRWLELPTDNWLQLPTLRLLRVGVYGYSLGVATRSLV